MATARRSWVLRILLGLLALIVVALVAGYWYARPLLLTGTGYAAHNACALHDLSARSDAATDLPPNPLVPYLRVGPDGGGFRATVLGFLAGQRAWPVPGFGCTVAQTAPDSGPATPIDPATNPLYAQPAPEASAALTSALSHAFGDDLDADSRNRLGTRAVVVVKDGTIVAERYADGFTAQTPQLGWSMSKSVTSLLVGVLAVGTALAAGARARTAADAAALAAAGAVADLGSAAQGCAAAAIYAGRNGAELTRCGIDGPVAQVTVRVSAGRLGWATARARAGPATPAAPRR